MTHRRTTLAILFVVGAALLVALPADAVERGNWMVRFQTLYVHPDANSGTVGGMADTGLDVDTDITWGFNLTYWVTPHFSLDLSFYDSKHDISGTGLLADTGDIADYRMFPPALSARWHFAPSKWITPYVGGGVNYTWFHDEEPKAYLLEPSGPDVTVSMDDTWGWHLQGGVDIYFHDHWCFNWEISYMDIDTETTYTEEGYMPVKTDLSIDPWVTGIGFGFRF